MEQAASELTGNEPTLALVGPFPDFPPSSSAPDVSVGVLRASGEYALIACESARAGERLFSIDGEPTGAASRYTIQVATQLHLDLSHGIGLEEMLDSYFWRFMNHSCEPNSRIEDQQVIAVTDIAAGEEITFHYNSTDLDMAEPFDCRCGNVNCAGRIAGFSSATAAERERLRPWLARHLLTGVGSAEGVAGPADGETARVADGSKTAY
ncbi:SET domain-containing protein-lysine N-methyltransferase [Streptomyces roseoverticillatus]|uniref:SET domain-containing protein-lysine N-methyltransferase n=1 Tax=Streptomyces roseoverticillatus TaxID=66429 RepID=UPI0033E39D24